MSGLIFEISRKGRSQKHSVARHVIRPHYCERHTELQETSELQVVRHYTNLSRKIFH